MKITRRLQPGETELFKQIRLKALLDAPYAFLFTYESAVQRSADSWREQAENAAHGTGQAIFIALADEVPVGVAALYRSETEPDTGEMCQVWVAPEHRGTRTALDLMDALFVWAGENNYHKIIASVTAGNTRALKFYLRYGFSMINEPLLTGSECTPLVKEVKGHATGSLPEA